LRSILTFNENDIQIEHNVATKVKARIT